MAKKIKLNDTLAVEFNQRARGEETPYWVGTIWDISGRKAVIIGDFKNEGTGGSTNVRLLANAPDRSVIVRMGKAAFSDLGVKAFEPAGAVIGWAEIVGYGLKCKPSDFTLQDWIDLNWGELESSERTTGQKMRAVTANAKAVRIEQAHRRREACRA